MNTQVDYPFLLPSCEVAPSMNGIRMLRLVISILGLTFLSGCVDPVSQTQLTDEIDPAEAFTLNPSESREFTLAHHLDGAIATGVCRVTVNGNELPSTVSLERTSCGCVEVQLDGRKLIPGDSFELTKDSNWRELEVQVAANSNATGNVRQSVTLNHNGNLKTFSVSRDVRAALAAAPRRLTVAVSDASQRATVGLVLTATCMQVEPLKVQPKLVIQGFEDFTFEVTSVGEITKWGQVFFTRTWHANLTVWRCIKNGTDHNDLSATVSLADGSYGLQISPLNIHVKRVSGVACPSVIHLGHCKVGEIVRRVFVVRALDGKSFSISRIDSDPRLTMVNVDKISNKHIVHTEVLVSEVGAFECSLKLQSTHPQDRDLTVCVRGSAIE